jgi:hypothetical protein
MNFQKLLSVIGPVPLHELSDDQLKELQKALSLLGYPVGDIDGLIGPKTRTAWAEFKTDIYPGNPELIEKDSVDALQTKVVGVKEKTEDDFSDEKGTIEAIKKKCMALDIGLKTQIAYVLATAKWETDKTFKPVREAHKLSEEWRKKNLRYYPYYGRGYVQLTWENNYRKYSGLLGVDLVNNPDLAMQPEIALYVLVHGFKTGIFTGRKITDYINQEKTDFIQARRCINGTDRASEIANIAEDFLKQL